MRRDAIAAAFRSRFQAEPELWVRAPGRVDLMGSHTDYNLGFVLTMAIDRDTWMAVRRSGSERVRLFAANLNAEASFDLSEAARPREKRQALEWGDYVRGVAWVLREAGFPLQGFNAVIDSTVPIGSGLSSSAALECAAAVAFRALGGWDLGLEEMASLCQRAENEYVGVNCGILDQYSSCLGRTGCALLLDCRDLSTRAVPIANGIQVVICDTKSRRELAGGEYGARRAQCEEGAMRLGVAALRDATLAQLQASGLGGEVERRCRFIVGESQRVVEIASALPAGDRKEIRRLCADSFAGARDLYEICSPSMVTMMDAMMRAPGVIGARQAGAGFGGCMVAFVEDAQSAEFGSATSDAYFTATGIRPEIYPVKAADGAGVMNAA